MTTCTPVTRARSKCSLASVAACGHHDRSYGANMTSEQYAQKRDKLYEQRTALIGQTKDPRAEMKALVATDKFDTAHAQALINDKTAALQTRSPEVIAAMADFYNSLNPA